MDINHQKEQYSKAWIHAITSVAGMAINPQSPDLDSVDWTISARIADGYPRSPKIDVQVKSTSSPDIAEGVIRYSLPRKNYDELRGNPINPRILVVLLIPSDPREWLVQSSESLAMRHTAHWVSLEGQPETQNDHRITVHVPLAQVFSVETLCEMMKRVEGGGRP